MCGRDDDPSTIEYTTYTDTRGGGEESDEEVLARLLASVNLAQIVHEALGHTTVRHGPPTCGNVAEAIEASLLARIRSRR